MNFIRFPFGLVLALLYQIAFNPLIQAALLLLTGHWRAALLWAGAWFALCLLAVVTGERRKSRMGGLEHVDIFTAPKWLNLLGDEEQGWTPQFLVDLWPRWVPLWFIAWSCCSWRNKLRNIAFWPPLAWLHKPKGELREHIWPTEWGGFKMRTRGWMTECEYWYGKRFGDFGPRLDFPDQWGGVTWALRPWGTGK